MKFRFSFLFLFSFIFQSASFAQGEFRVSGIVERYGDRLGGAAVSIYKDGVFQEKIITGSDGKFLFKLDLNKNYILEASKPGHIPVKVELFTHLPSQKTINGTHAEFFIKMDIFEAVPYIDFSILDKPVAQVRYYKDKNKFDYDRAYFLTVKERLKTLNDKVKHTIKKRKKPMLEEKSNRDR